ncbi:polysaccharide biosynthesis/export family protein [Ancylobacter sp. SL191]|uniref:polysaccharide biosynthesis/export family protein n=1 Tax=Ancylobacter sp. SL191 TaxID=2995166 RepID=UPI002270A375|nr:polysaccharide biosynthesis/export family protein [Ancylobacter sp. SL191]WAC25924.1 polysaccharide export protein [Ancylobacter sp. SL191]
MPLADSGDDAPRFRAAARAWRGRQGAVLVPALLLAVMLAGCTTSRETTGSVGKPQSPGDAFTTGQELRFTEVNPQGFRPWSSQVPPYRIGPGDKLKIKYFLTRDMDEELTVSPDGTVAPRAIGQLKVEGMTLAGAQEVVRRASRVELADQKVVIALEDPVSAKVYIGGMVERPGPYNLSEMRNGTLQGILTAGGFTEEARTGQVAIIRRGPDNMPMLRLVDVKEIIQTGFTLDDVQLVSGDIIYVPRSSVAELNVWIDQFINKVVPFQRSFNYTMGTQSTVTP